jgi:hypothetical protein
VTDAIDAIVSKHLKEAAQEESEEPEAAEAPGSTRVRGLLYLGVFAGLALLGVKLNEPTEWKERMRSRATTPIEFSLESTLARVGIEPFVGRVTGPTECDAHVVAGADTIEATGGAIPGLGSRSVADTLISSDPDGPWIQELTRQLEEAEIDTPDTLCLALDKETTARELFLFGHSAQRAGFRRTGLVLRRDNADDELGILAYRTRIPSLSRNARVVIRVGRLGVYTQVMEPDGAPRGKALSPIAMLEDGSLDLRRIDVRLQTLKTANSDIRTAVLEVTRDLPIQRAIRLIERASIGDEGERFSRIQLRLR